LATFFAHNTRKTEIMTKFGIITSMIFATILISCNSDKSKTNPKVEDVNQVESESDTLSKHLKPFRKDLPTIGLLMYNGVLQSEVIATSDVFAKPTED